MIAALADQVRGSNCSNLVEIGRHDDVSTFNLNSEVDFTEYIDQDYYIQVSCLSNPARLAATTVWISA